MSAVKEQQHQHHTTTGYNEQRFCTNIFMKVKGSKQVMKEIRFQSVE